MKRVVSILMLLTLMGCSTVRIPAYIPEKKVFAQRFYAGYPRVMAACKQALTDLGWTVEKEMEPQVFEVAAEELDTDDNILLVTAVRATRMFVGTRYARMNIYIRSKKDVSDVEIRYLVVNDMFLFKPKFFGNDSFAKRFFEKVQGNLGA